MKDNKDKGEKFEDNVINLFADESTEESSEEDSDIDEETEEFDHSIFLSEATEEDESNVTPINSAPRAKRFLSASVFLKTKNSQLLPKVINEIHAMSGRYACLPFESLAAGITSVEDLWSLGQITIVINDILNLTPAQRDLVASYLERSQSLSDLGPELNDIPLLLISATSPVESLINSQVIELSFAEQIESCILEVDRLPVPTLMLKATLELFLEPGAIL